MALQASRPGGPDVGLGWLWRGLAQAGGRSLYHGGSRSRARCPGFRGAVDPLGRRRRGRLVEPGCLADGVLMSSEALTERAGLLANRVRLAEEGGDPGAVVALVSEAVDGLGAAEANEVLRGAERLVPGLSAGRALTAADGSVVVVSGAELRDADFLASELAASASGLGADERRALGERLAASGIAGQTSAEAGAEAVARAKRALGLTDGSEVSTERLIEALSLLLETVRTLDTLAWRTWRTMAQQSNVRKRGDLHVLLGRYVAGSGGETAESVGEDLARFRTLVASLLAAIGQAGEVAYERVRTVSPLHIESLADADKRAVESVEAARWRVFRELASQLDEATVQSETMKSLAAFAERLMAS